MLSVSTFTSIINQVLPEPHAGLLSGILFGVKATLDPTLYDALIKTGTLHIVALSGMNITLLTGIVNISILQVLPRRIAAIATVAVIVGFILFVGPSASIIRAGIMGGIGCMTLLFGRRAWALWSWAVAVILMLAVKPLWITDLSFQLSVLASLGMIVFGSQRIDVGSWTVDGGNKILDVRDQTPEIRNWSLSCVSFLYNGLHETLAAQSLTIPLLLFTFGRLSLISPVTNVLIVWTLPIIMVLGFFVCIFGYFFFPFGQVFAWGSWVFLEYIIRIIEWSARIPFANIEW